MSILDDIAAHIIAGEVNEVHDLTTKALAEGFSAGEILDNGLVAGMNTVGDRFKNNEMFIPEVLVSARAMKAGMEIIKPLLAKANVESKGRVVIGTVKGDLHDIGKNIVGMLLEGAGFEVVDLGADVSKEQFMEVIEQGSANLIGLSALLTTTMTYMKEVIQAVEAANMRDKIKVIIGGAPITQAFADEINADGYAPDAASAVDLAKSVLNLT